MELTPGTFVLIAFAVALVVILAAFISRKGVFAPPFERRPLMNQTELRLFKMLRAELPAGWCVTCQVAYGAFLRNKSYKRYMSINSKRADFVLLDADLNIALVIEYQGKGHFGTAATAAHVPRKAIPSSGRHCERQGLNSSNCPRNLIATWWRKWCGGWFCKTVLDRSARVLRSSALGSGGGQMRWPHRHHPRSVPQ